MAQKKPTIKDVVVKVNKNVKRDYVYAVGRQKSAVARVRLHEGVRDGKAWGDHAVNNDQMLVNAMPIEKYFSGLFAKSHYMLPFEITNTVGKFAFTIKVAGGGKNGQLDALVHGIARALAKLDPEKYRTALKQKGLLMHDARVRERRKVGTGGKARRQKQSPKR